MNTAEEWISKQINESEKIMQRQNKGFKRKKVWEVEWSDRYYRKTKYVSKRSSRERKLRKWEWFDKYWEFPLYKKITLGA